MSNSNSKKQPYEVVVFYNGTEAEGDVSDVIVDTKVVAKDSELASLKAAYLVPEEYRADAKLERLEITVRPVTPFR